MNKYLSKPKNIEKPLKEGRYERFNLRENPFPANPFVNKDSSDIRINGDIYEKEIRKREYEQIKKHFLKNPQDNENHNRLGFIVDASYIGRGNGKSAFLVNLNKAININYNLDISENINKCFCVYLSPESGGRTKTFLEFTDRLFSSIIQQNIINTCFAILRLEAINEIYPEKKIEFKFNNDDDLVAYLNKREWFDENEIDLVSISKLIYNNKYLQKLPVDFPIFKWRQSLFGAIVKQDDFNEYYFNVKKASQKLDFIYSNLISLFFAAGFNGAYILVDDFERIPDFQSSRQKRDFAFEIRSCFFDGIYENAKYGFYNLILVLHAGVERLIQDGWADSGMDNRVPISPQMNADYIIRFEKLTEKHAKMLIKKYLDEFRIDKNRNNDLFPFTEDAIKIISEKSDLNATKILKLAYRLIELAINNNINEINGKFIWDHKEQWNIEDKKEKDISSMESTNLLNKAKGNE